MLTDDEMQLPVFMDHAFVPSPPPSVPYMEVLPPLATPGHIQAGGDEIVVAHRRRPSGTTITQLPAVTPGGMQRVMPDTSHMPVVPTVQHVDPMQDWYIKLDRWLTGAAQAPVQHVESLTHSLVTSAEGLATSALNGFSGISLLFGAIGLAKLVYSLFRSRTAKPSPLQPRQRAAARYTWFAVPYGKHTDFMEFLKSMDIEVQGGQRNDANEWVFGITNYLLGPFRDASEAFGLKPRKVG